MAQRVVTARLLHRFNFGPIPGQYVELLNRGIGATQATVLTHGVADAGLNSVVAPVLADLGPFPTPGTPASTAFTNAIVKGNFDLITWWLDRMAVADYPLTERMTWF